MKCAHGYAELLIAALLLAGGISTRAAAQTYDVKRLGPSDFPARVQAIVFSSGRVLDESRTVSWGRWTVGLDETDLAPVFRIP